jgi:FSR family fosmidomycin resistance protein-like MFS transporter
MFKRTYSRMWAVSTAHFSVDMLSSMNAVTFTFMSAHLMTLSKAQIGLAISLYGLAGAFSQPFFGWFADKTGGKYLGVFGAAWLAGMLMLAYFAGISTQSYPLMVGLLALASLGSGAFHPVGALHTAETDKAHSARNLTYFFLAGQLGLALGPALAGWLLDQTLRGGSGGSITPLLLLTLIAIPGILWMQRTLPSRQQHAETHPALVGEAGSLRGIPVYPLLFLALVVALRSLSNPGAATFLPSLFEEKGWTAEHYGQVTSMYWLAGAFSALVVTPLAGRFGSRAVIGGTMLLGAPMFWLLPQADGGLWRAANRLYADTRAVGGRSLPLSHRLRWQYHRR